MYVINEWPYDVKHMTVVSSEIIPEDTFFLGVHFIIQKGLKT